MLVKSIQNLFVLFLSLIATCLVVEFVQGTSALKIKSSPKALTNLQDIFLPPMMNMQLFVLVFDAAACAYFIYHWPLWNKLKSGFAYYQYESQSKEKGDCSNLFLSILFFLMSKV